MENAGKELIVRSLRSRTLKPEDVLDTVIHSNEKQDTDIEEEMATGKDDATFINTPMEVVRNKALQNHLILGNCFRFLNLEDVKQSRLVCAQWSEISISFLKKMSVIPLVYPGKEDFFEEHSLRSFKDLFGNSAVGTNFSSFKLQTSLYHEAIWPAANLKEFLVDQRLNMKELSIENVKVQESGVYQSFFDLNPFIEPHLLHLIINSELGTQFKVSTEKLTWMKYLCLQHCPIDFVNNCLLGAKKLELNDVAISKDGEIVEKFKVNDIIDFKLLKALTLVGKSSFETESGSSALSLELVGNVTLDYLSLSSVEILNFEKATWSINGKLELKDVPFVNQTQMNFKELDFQNSTLFLISLPDTVEKLTLNAHGTETAILCPPHSLVLPNLKYLHFLTDCSFEFEMEDEFNDEEFDENDIYCLYFVSLFSESKNLKTVKLSCDNSDKHEYLHEYDLEEIDQLLVTKWIPQSTENLFLSGNIVVAGHEFQLEKLVIQDNRFSDLRGMLHLLKSKYLVLDFNSESPNSFSELEGTILAIVRMPYQRVAIGSLKINEITFSCSSFSKCVDKRAEYYLFENHKGKAITESQFKEIIEA